MGYDERKDRNTIPKLAVLTTDEAGKPAMGDLHNAMRICYSTDTDLDAALDGAQVAFLWDAGLAHELEHALERGSANDLQWVHAAVTGVDKLPLRTFDARGITLTNAAGTYNDAIAEYVLAACLGFERKMPLLHEQQRAHEWAWQHGGMLSGKHILIIGPGRIGQACARLFRAFQCDVAALGSHSKPATNLFSSIEPSSKIKERIAWGDHIIITAPLTEDTYHLLNAQAFAACKPSAHIVNVGRGGIIDTNALIHALTNGRLAGATLDVLENEPLEKSSMLWDMPNVTITPHIAGDVDDFEGVLIEQFIENAQRWLRKKPLKGIVDLSRGY